MNPEVQIWSSCFCSVQIKTDIGILNSRLSFTLTGGANATFPVLSVSLTLSQLEHPEEISLALHEILIF